MSHYNINSGNQYELCTSCQMCAAVCHKQAITISLDNWGFYRPIVDEDLCVDCGQCVKVCVKYDNNITSTSNEELSGISLYAASALDDEIVAKTTSGGIADLLAKQLIAEGYKVIGVIYNPQTNRAEGRTARNTEEADAFRGSKYIQSYNLDAFREFVKSCKKEKIAVFGLPCQIYAAYKLLERYNCRDNSVLIDLYCHGCPSMLVWDKVSDHIKKKTGTDYYTIVNWRSKLKGWGKFVLETHGTNGSQYHSEPLNNEFFDFFFSNLLLNDACNECKLRSTLAYCDIRLGDFWGRDYKKTDRGVSAVSVVTERGMKLFAAIKNKMKITSKKYSSFLPYQSWGHSYSVDYKLRNEILGLLRKDNSTLEESIRPLKERWTIKKKAKIIIKQILFYFK